MLEMVNVEHRQPVAFAVVGSHVVTGLASVAGNSVNRLFLRGGGFQEGTIKSFAIEQFGQ
ncbi:hypothetical protein GALL_312790 [mine drainage metagenome]|uniref:Uncharacterized protein n=1 Tax=mine drainage metagenome TaxID=410659 RepID=A0A1J5QTQ4_9ZZZZ